MTFLGTVTNSFISYHSTIYCTVPANKYCINPVSCAVRIPNDKQILVSATVHLLYIYNTQYQQVSIGTGKLCGTDS